jgi:hypothetical protein
MKDSALKAALEREERAYEDLLQVRASFGTMLWETIRRGKDLSEFVQHTRDLSLLTRSADIRRTELKVELLARELKKAEDEQRRAIEAARRVAAALEEVRRSYARAANAERRWGHETQRLEELRREEMARLERLRSEEAEQQQERSQEPPGAPQPAPEEVESAVEEPRPDAEGAMAEGAEATAETVRGSVAPEQKRPAERPWWRRMFEG